MASQTQTRRRRTRVQPISIWLCEPIEPRLLLTTYYVSPTGNDASTGTSAANAWKTITKADSVNLGAGDQLLFQGGATFTAPAASTTNLIADPGFESGSLGTWSESFDTNANSSVATSNYHTASHALRVGGTGNGGAGESLASKLAGNSTYLVSLWAKLLSGTGQATASVSFYSGGVQVSQFTVNLNSSAYTKYSFAVVAPPSFDSADLWIKKADGTSVLYADDVAMYQTYSTLVFDGSDSGAASSHVTIGSYGSGNATLNAGDGYGLYARDVSDFDVQDLNFVGTWNGLAATGTNAADGVEISNDQSGNTKLDSIDIDDVNASGFHWAGISVSGDNGKSGFTDVRITNSTAHDNGDVGIRVEGTFDANSTLYAHSNVYVGYCSAYNNGGLPNKGNNSGNGILLGDINGGTIERCVAYNNGQNCNNPGGGPVGIWAWDSNNITIQYNESYANRTSTSSLDGGGFDLDGGVTNSFLQYNDSHDNDGAGFLLYQFTGARAYGNNTIRYNISQNDGRQSHYAGIYMGGGTAVINNQIYNNTVYISPTSDSTIAAMKITGVGTGNKFRNNIFYTTGGVELLNSNSAYSTSSVLFQGNDWYPSNGAFSIEWGGVNYLTLSSWRAKSQEMNGSAATGVSVDPKLVSAGGGGTIGEPSELQTLVAYELLPTSPMINAGVNLVSLGISPGSRDFFGGSNFYNGAYDIGAFESDPAITGTSSADAFLLRVGPTGNIELFENTPTASPPTLAWAPGVYTTYAITGNGGGDTMTLDLSNGNPLPSSGASFTGSGGGSHLIVDGSSNNNTIALSSSTVTPSTGSPAFNYAGVGDVVVDTGAGNDTLKLTAAGPAASVSVDLGTGNDTLSINGGNYTFNSDAVNVSPNLAVNVASGASATFNSSQHLGSLAISGTVTLAPGGDKVLVTKSLTLSAAAQLNLNDDTAIVDYTGNSPLGTFTDGAYTGLTGEVASGRNGGAWNGPGIISSFVPAKSIRYTVGIGEAADLLSLGGHSTGTFLGQTVDSTAVLIRYTLIGDTDLNHVITGDDFFREDNGFASQQTGFAHGDFDYNGIVDADDYFYIDANYAYSLP